VAISVLVYSHHCHLKTTQALEHVKQAQETSPRKNRPGMIHTWIGGEKSACVEDRFGHIFVVRIYIVEVM